MVLIEGGCFKIGDAFGEGNSDDPPLHEVCVSGFKLDSVANSEFFFRFYEEFRIVLFGFRLVLSSPSG